MPAPLNNPTLVAWAFLAVSVWGGAFTLNAHHPRPHDTRTSPVGLVISFFSAWLTSELVLHHLVVQVLVTGGFVYLGALGSWPGWLGATITLVSWVGLGVLYHRAHRDRDTVQTALRDDLGPTGPPPRIRWRQVLWPFGLGGGIERHADIPYLDDGSSRHRLDVYRRPNLEAGAPVLLQIHGGAWIVGDKSQQGRPLVHHLAEQGWLCVSTNYGLSPRATWPDHLVDCKRALAWIRAHAHEYGGDASCVVVTGGSAGGHLTAMMGLTANDPEYQPGFEDVDTSVAAFVPFYGVFDWTDRFGIRGSRDALRKRLESWIVKKRRDEAFAVFDRASPLSRVEGEIPPAMVIHGRRDNLAPVAEARRFVEALRSHSQQPVVYVELEGAHHAFDVFSSVRTVHTIHGVAAFAQWVAQHHRGAVAGTKRAAS